LKAIRFYDKNDIRLEDIPIPDLDKNEVLIKVKKVAITQTLANEYFYGPYITKQSLPLIPGHSFGGIIVKVGEKVDKNLIGKWVSVLPLISCGKCSYCKAGYDNLCNNLKYYGLIKQDGGLAEYVKVNIDNIFVLDKNNIDKTTFIEPLLIAMNIFDEATSRYKYKFPNKNSMNILILGAGAIGFLTSLVWNIFRKEDNIFINDLFLSRLEKLKDVMILNSVYNINFIEKEYIKREHFDIVIDTAGFEPLAFEPAIQEGFKYLSRGGCLVSASLYYNRIELNQGEILLNSRSILTTIFYRKQLIRNLPEVLSKLKLDFSKVISKIDMKDVLSKGFYKAHIDKEEFIRLEVEC